MSFLSSISSQSSVKESLFTPLSNDQWHPGTWLRKQIDDNNSSIKSLVFHHAIALTEDYIIEANIEENETKDDSIEETIKEILTMRCIPESLINDLTKKHKLSEIYNYSQIKLVKLFKELELNMSQKMENRLIEALSEVCGALPYMRHVGKVSISKPDNKTKKSYIVIKQPESLEHGLCIVSNALQDCGKSFRYSVLWQNCEHFVLRWWSHGQLAFSQTNVINRALLLGALYVFVKLAKVISHKRNKALESGRNFFKVIVDELKEYGAPQEMVQSMTRHGDNLTASNIKQLANAAATVAADTAPTAGSSAVNTVNAATEMVADNIGWNGNPDDQSEQLAEDFQKVFKFLSEKWSNRENKGKWIGKLKGKKWFAATDGNESIAINNDMAIEPVKNAVEVPVNGVKLAAQEVSSDISTFDATVENKWNWVTKYHLITLGVVVAIGVGYVTYEWYKQRYHMHMNKNENKENKENKDNEESQDTINNTGISDIMCSSKSTCKLMIALEYELNIYQNNHGHDPNKNENGIKYDIPNNIEYCIQGKGKQIKVCKLSEQDKLDAKILYKWLRGETDNINLAGYFYCIIEQGYGTIDRLTAKYKNDKSRLKKIFKENDNNLQKLYEKLEKRIKLTEKPALTLCDWLKDIDCEDKEAELQNYGINSVESLFDKIKSESDLENIDGLGGGHIDSIWEKMEEQKKK